MFDLKHFMCVFMETFYMLYSKIIDNKCTQEALKSARGLCPLLLM